MTILSDLKRVRSAARAQRRGATVPRAPAAMRQLLTSMGMNVVRKYARGNTFFADLLRNPSALRSFFQILESVFGGRPISRRDVEAAVRIVQAAGFGVTARPRARPPGPPPAPPVQAPPIQRPRRTAPPPTDFDEQVAVRREGRMLEPREQDRIEARARDEGRIHLVESSNVYAYWFEREGRFDGVLYVTFLAWAPGQKTRSGVGPTYAYYGVPVRKYMQFKGRAASSAGKAVWDFLRVRGRGNAHRHQHPYRLTAGAEPSEAVEGNRGVYVPRKLTRTGFRVRNLPDITGRSNLPAKSFRVPGNRARRQPGGRFV